MCKLIKADVVTCCTIRSSIRGLVGRESLAKMYEQSRRFKYGPLGNGIMKSLHLPSSRPSSLALAANIGMKNAEHATLVGKLRPKRPVARNLSLSKRVRQSESESWLSNVRLLVVPLSDGEDAVRQALQAHQEARQ